MLFTSFNVYEPQGAFDNNLAPYYHRSQPEYSPKPFETQSNLKKRNLNIESTSNTQRGLSAPYSSLNMVPRPDSRLGSQSSLSFYPEVGKLLPQPTSTGIKDFPYKSEEKDMEKPKKQIKTETGGVPVSSTYYNKPLVPKLCNFFNEGEEEEEKDPNVDYLVQLEDLNTCYNFWGTYEEQEEDKVDGTSPAKEVDPLKDDFSNKYEDMAGPGELLNISFEVPPETPKQSEIDEACSPVSSVDCNIENAQSNCLLSDSETSNSQPSTVESYKESSYDIRGCLEGITESDIQRLEPEIYLNDNLINFYLKLIENGFLTEERKRKVYCFNTYFMSRMLKLFSDVGGDFTQFDQIYEKMKKWTKKINIFEKDYLFIPVNENEHWNLIILCHPWKMFSKDNEFPKVIYVDSLCRMDNKFSTMLFQYIAREVKSKVPHELKTLQYKVVNFRMTSFPYFQHMVPKQSNTTDCGLYLLQYIEMFAEDESFLTNNIEEINKTKWFPRKLIEEKRTHIKKLIRGLRANRLDTIEKYLLKRNQIIEEMKNTKSQFNSFSKKGFEKALTTTYGDSYLTDQDKACLMIDYYYFGTLDFDQSSSACQN